MLFVKIIPLILYLGAIIGMAFVVSRKSKNNNFVNSYFIDNRSMSGFVLAMTSAATYVSAGSFIGGPGAAYKYGLGWILIAMIQVPTMFLALGVIGQKVAHIAKESNAITVNDLLFHKYKSKAVTLISSASLLISFCAIIIVQFIGAGRLLETTLNIDYKITVLIFALIVSGYTFVGGFRAVILTDTLQGIIMLLGTIILVIALIVKGGGIPNIVEKINHIDPKLLDPLNSSNKGLSFMLSFWVLVCFGTIALPQLIVRSMAYKDQKALNQAIIIGTIVITLLMLGMHLAGFFGRALIDDTNLQSPDQIIPKLMVTVLPTIIAGIFLIAPIAAIMSSVDSLLIQSSATIIKDLYLQYKPNTKTSTIKILTKLVNIILIVILTTIAMYPPEMLIWLNLFSLGILEATFLWVFILGLFWKKANSLGAITSMIAGFVSYIILNTTKFKILDLHPVVPALIISLIAFLIGNKFYKSEPKNLIAN